MTRDEITAWAREAGYHANVLPITEVFARFAALVAAKEREACAQTCETLRFSDLGPSPTAKFQRDLCAKAIRARTGGTT